MPATDGEFGQSRVYRRQGATEITVASGGRVVVEAGGRIDVSGQIVMQAGGVFDASAGAITLPGVLREGVIDLRLGDAWEVSSADSLNPLTSGTNPSIGRVNAGTDPKGRIAWTSAAGGADKIQWDVHLPTDLSTAFPLRLQLYGEVASGAVNGWDADVFFGVGDADAGSTVALTSSPANSTISIASGDIIANTPVAIAVGPVSATGTVTLYGARLVYTKRTS